MTEGGWPKILCLTSHSPEGPAYGARLRARNIFRLLGQFGEVSVVLAGPYGTVDSGASGAGPLEPMDVFEFEPWKRSGLGQRVRGELDPRFLNTHGVRISGENRRKLQALIEEHDIVWVHGLRIANACGLWRWPRSILDIDDVPSGFHASACARAAGIADKLREWRQATLWRRRERLLLQRFDAVAVCSEQDLRHLGGSERIVVVPNGHDAPDKAVVRAPALPPRIGFVGTLEYAPNAQGLRWFLEKAWPLIRQSAPGVTLRLVGKDSDNAAWRAYENVAGLGWVADADAEMATWSLAIVPLFVGGGTRIKIATAFSQQCPVVATELGAFGYSVVNGRELLLANTPADFANACVRLLQDRRLADQLAETAWKTWLANWTWDAIAPKVKSLLQLVRRRQEGLAPAPGQQSGPANPLPHPRGMQTW